MSADGLTDRIEQMIRFDRLGDAIELLLAVTPKESRYRDELIGHAGSLARIERSERLGVAATATHEARIRLTQAALELSALLARSVQTDRRATLHGPVVSVPKDSSLEKIIGANNLKKIAWLEQGLTRAAAIGRIVCQGHRGTGFLIERGRVVTNHHVLSSPRQAEQAIIEFNYQEDLNGRLLRHFAYRFDASRFRTDENLDVTIVGVLESADVPPLEQWGVLPMNRSAPSPGDHVSIIQHPEGGVKQIACTANQVVNVFEYRLQYLTDTLPGSSGAPVFDDAWSVVAIHHAGGDLATNAQGDSRYVNEGILAGRIAHLLD